MGMFKDMKEAFGVVRSDELKELKKKSDAQPKPSMMEGIRAANQAMDAAQSMQSQGIMDPTTGALYTNGIQGSATIEGLSDTGQIVNNAPVMEMDLKVTVPGKDPYSVKHRQIVAHVAMGNFQPGKVFPVRVDQNDPQRIVIG